MTSYWISFSRTVIFYVDCGLLVCDTVGDYQQQHSSVAHNPHFRHYEDVESQILISYPDKPTDVWPRSYKETK
jgi:hypothetical protein